MPSTDKIAFILALVALVFGTAGVLLALLLHGGLSASPAGLKGDKGDPGNQGATGPAGEQGDQGAAGYGASATISTPPVDGTIGGTLTFFKQGQFVNVHFDVAAAAAIPAGYQQVLNANVPTTMIPAVDVMGPVFVNNAPANTSYLVFTGVTTYTGQTPQKLYLWTPGGVGGGQTVHGTVTFAL